MSITRTERPFYKIFQPGVEYNSPLPVGRWIATCVVISDASGGVITVTIGPASAAEAAKYLWSVEAMTLYRDASATPVNFLVELNTGEYYVTSIGGTSSPSFGMGARILDEAAGPSLGSVYNNLNLKRWPIHQPEKGLTNSYLMSVANVNGLSYTFSAWGWIWHPQANRLAGGPVKPW